MNIVDSVATFQSRALGDSTIFHLKKMQKNRACKHSIKSTFSFILPISGVKIQCVLFIKKSVPLYDGNGERTRTPLIYSKQSVI